MNCCHGVGCPFMTTLRLNGCIEVTDESLVQLSTGCPLMAELMLNSCTEVTDKGVKALGKGCKLITELHLNNCTKVTDKGVKAVARNCRTSTMPVEVTLIAIPKTPECTVGGKILYRKDLLLLLQKDDNKDKSKGNLENRVDLSAYAPKMTNARLSHAIV